jgi:hypothetical protein
VRERVSEREKGKSGRERKIKKDIEREREKGEKNKWTKDKIGREIEVQKTYKER